MLELSLDEARKIALAAQGFAQPRPRRVDRGAIRKTIRRLHAFQIDSVNVLVRAHYLPLFSRLGPYDPAVLDRMTYRDRELFEYWGHQASLLPVDLHPLFRWRMDPVQTHRYWKEWAVGNAEAIERIYAEVAERGPLGAGDLAEPGERSGPWWGWSKGKSVLEYLFLQGKVSVADRRNFERVYDVTERVIPDDVLSRPTPSQEEAGRGLVQHASRALGLATERDLADYFWVKPTRIRPIVASLVEEGELEPLRVEGWPERAYRHRDAKPLPARAGGSLVSPFDSLVWFRPRVERLFGFRYRIEIYVPAPKRVHGYYVLPFLLGENFVARVDAKADRKASVLLVPGAFAEPGIDKRFVAAELAQELRLMASWLGLGDVRVAQRGTLARELRAAVR